MSYLELEGQQEVVKELERLTSAERPASCFLLVSESGKGELRFVAEWAKAVNCLKNHFFKDCDCASCQKIEKHTHPDVFWLGEDSEDRTLKIDQVRDLQEKANIRPYEGQKKVFIIVGAERLTEEASNAMLKTLEEPPNHTLFILISSEPDKLLSTIQSRLLKLTLRKLALSEMEEVLSNKVDWVKSEIEFLTSFSRGSLGRAIQLHEEGFFNFKNKVISGYLKNSNDFFTQLDPSDREALRKVIQVLASFTRDAFVNKMGSKTEYLIHRDRVGDISQWAQSLSLDQLMARLSHLEEAESALDQNLNGRLIVLKLQEAL
jgi:DNA polymerase-3 subunit delta'